MDNKSFLFKDAYGKYFANAFSITLHPDIDIFINEEKDEFEVIIDEAERPKLAIFIHEYWHYLLNISTFSRYHDFSICFHLLAIFSSTLMKYGNGASSGNEGLSQELRTLAKSMVKMLRIYRGDIRPNINGTVRDFKVIGYSVKEEKINVNKSYQAHQFIQLKLEIESTNGSEEHNFILGSTAIEESLVTIIESFIYQSSPKKFPYLVVPKLVNHLSERPIPNLDILTIMTLSLLTPTPSVTLISLIEFYDQSCRNIVNSNDRRVALISKVINIYESSVPYIKKELKEIEELVKERATFKMAAKSFTELFSKMIKIRKANYLFDLEPFMSGELSNTKLEKFINSYKPCDVIQRKIGAEDTLNKDDLFSFETNVFDQANSSIYLKPFQASLS